MADFAFTRQDESNVSSTTTKTVPLTCHGHSRPITHLSFSALLTSPSNPSPHASTQDGQYYMISACKDNNPMLRDGLTGDWIGTFIGHKGAVWSSRVSSDAGLAATGSADFTAKVWDTFTGECLGSLEHNHIVRAVAFPGLEGRAGVLATGGMEKRLRVWDLSRITNATPTTNGTNGTSHTATAADTPSYEIGSGEHQGAIKSIVWSRDPNVLTTAADDKKIRWWDLRSRSSIASYTIDALPTSCELNSGLNGDPAGTLSVAAGKNIYFFLGTQLFKHIKTEREVSAVALNGEAKRFVTGSPADTWVHVWDYETEVQLETGKGHHGPVWTCGFSPDGKLYATGSEDGTVKLWKFGEGGLWKTGDYSDLTIRCGSKEWKVHKAVLCTQCDFFKAACNGQFKEASTNVIDMAADEPEAVGLMLESLYGYDYLDGRDTRASTLKTHVWIAQIATKYMLPQLRWAAIAGFGSASTEAWQCDEFAEAVDMICFLGEEAGGLTDIATKVIVEHAAALLHDDAYRCFQEVLGKHASLAMSVAKGLSRVGLEKEMETDDWPSFQLTKKKKSRRSAMGWDI